MKKLKLSLGQELTKDEFEEVSKHAFIDGQTDIVVKQFLVLDKEGKSAEITITVS